MTAQPDADAPLVLVDLLSYTGTKGGMETYARELYRQIGRLESGMRFVGLASREGAALDMSWFPGEVVDSGISGERRFEWARGELFGVSRWAKRLDVDLIHCPALLGPRRTKAPVVLTLHDLLYFSHPQYMTTPLYTRPVMWMERMAARNAERVLTISQASAAEIRRYLGVPDERLDVVPLAGFPMQGVEPRPASAVHEQRERPYILATGNRRPHKNWASLIRALPLIDEARRPNLIVTGSHGDDPLRAVVEETGMDRWVELKGWVSQDEMADLFRNASAMAMPSFCDGFCLPALEAMMVGIPVLLSDIPVYREVGGEAAVYFDPHDLQSIADAMAMVRAEPHALEHLVEAGYEQAARFSWEQVARDTVDVFRRALRAPVSAPA